MWYSHSCCALGLAFVAAAVRGGRLSQVFQFQKTRITQKFRAGEVKDHGWGHPFLRQGKLEGGRYLFISGGRWLGRIRPAAWRGRSW